MSGGQLDRRLNAFRDDLADRRLEGRVAAARFVDGVPRQIALEVAVPLRRAPRADAPVDTEALCGEPLLVFDEQDGWSWVQLEGDGYVGYLRSAALGVRRAPATHRVTALRTFVYPKADIKAPSTGLLTMGSLVTVAGEGGSLVRIASGGYVSARHLAPIGAAVGDPVAVAARFLGTPYLWGGKTSLGLDCSGLVQVAMQASGLACPRDSDMQREALGRPCAPDADWSRLRRGDLLFWQGHVGIVPERGRLLHANAFHMEVVDEPLGPAIQRIAAGGSPVLAVGRMDTATA